MAVKSQGILPLATYSFQHLDPGIGLGPWKLPGHGHPYANCGDLLIFGCKNVEDHHQARIDGIDVLGKVYVKLKKRTCLRPQCPTCYEKWAGRGAHRIENRISNYKGSGKAIHLMVSVPHDLYHIPMVKLRRKAQGIARKVGFFGGSCIIHPFREHCIHCHEPKDTKSKRCPNCGCKDFSWYFSPHFHMIGMGWIQGKKVADIYKCSGWITKNLGIRDSVGATALYQLSHCGIHPNHDSVTWFGTMSRNKMKTIPREREKETCPLCGAELTKLHWVGEDEMPFQDEGEFYDDPENWVRGFRSYG